jgi:hypothetical protein
LKAWKHVSVVRKGTKTLRFAGGKRVKARFWRFSDRGVAGFGRGVPAYFHGLWTEGPAHAS